MYDNDVIKEHYSKVAEKYQDSAESTMEDTVVRQKEMAFIQSAILYKQSQLDGKRMDVLEVGLGNGYVMNHLSTKIKNVKFCGVEYTKELLEIAMDRKIENVTLVEGDARCLPYESESFDVVYTERCLINILDVDGQHDAIDEIVRVLKPGGVYIMVECFSDGYDNYNRARVECGLTNIPVAHHNLYFDKSALMNRYKGMVEFIDHFVRGEEEFSYNFLSTHFFMSRVLHPLVTQGDKVKNTEFVKFFSYMPSVGDYSPIQGYLLEKKV